jgi:predicted nucleic acid-binding protein
MQSSKREGRKRVKIFLDSSVIIAAVLSHTGGSFRLIKESAFKNYALLISEYVLAECIRTIKTKFPTREDGLMLLLTNFNFKILKDSASKEVEKLIDIIDFQDAPILAAALKYKVEYLITLDKKDFLNQRILKFAKKRGLLILTPGELIQKLENH